MLLEDYPRARWRDIRLGERHCDAALDPTAFADRHLRGRAKGDLVASGLHIDAMKPHAGELDTAAQCTSNAASNPVGSVKSWDTSHSFAAFQLMLSRMA